MHRARLLSFVALVLGLPCAFQAGLVQIWQLKEIAAAPVFVVGRVLAVQQDKRVPEDSLRWKAETWSMTADVEVLRSYSASGNSIAEGRLRLQFLAYGPSVTRFVNGDPPPLPNLETGQVLILPLLDNRNQASPVWRLTAESGMQLTVPVSAGVTDESSSRPTTGLGFVLQELANTLSRGTPGEVSLVSSYLTGLYEDLSGELLPPLSSAIGGDRQRWAEVAANLLAAQGIPRPGVRDLVSGEPKDMRANPHLAQAALRKLGASPETDLLLIRTWIAEAPLHAWGSANSLLEYANNPATTETLRQALRDDVSGSSYIALVLAHGGNTSIIPEALARALQVADRPNAKGKDLGDLQGAAALLRDFGSDGDLTQMAALVRKYQILDPDFYNVLWQYATEAGNPREVRVLSVVLNDRRILSGDTRYCDFALGVLERAVGQDFGTNRETVPSRDEAVSRALVWIRRNQPGR